MARRAAVLYDSGHVRVTRDPNRATGRVLVVAGMEASYVDVTDPTYLEFSYVRRFRDAVQLAWPARTPLDTVHIGAGGGTFPRFLLAARREVTCDVYEPDREVVAVARRLLGLHASPRLRVHLGDGRRLLEERSEASADLVVEDAFVDGLPPERLSSVEYCREVARVLRPGGLHLLNVVDAGELRLARRVASTLLAVWPDLLAMAPRMLLRGRGVGNVVFAAGAPELAASRLGQRCGRDVEPYDVLPPEDVQALAAGAQPLHDPPA